MSSLRRKSNIAFLDAPLCRAPEGPEFRSVRSANVRFQPRSPERLEIDAMPADKPLPYRVAKSFCPQVCLLASKRAVAESRLHNRCASVGNGPAHIFPRPPPKLVRKLRT